MQNREVPQFKYCKHCKMQIPTNAKVCPYCRKKQKGGVLKWILIGLIVLLLLGAVGGQSGKKKNGKVGSVQDGAVSVNESAENAASAENTKEAAQSAEEAAATDDTANDTAADAGEPAGEETEDAGEVQSIYHVGDVLQENNLQIVYMSSGEYNESNEFLQPRDGYTYYYLQFAFENTSDSSDASVSMYEFKGYADGYNVDQYFGGDDNLSGTLSPGRVTTGYVYYEVPVGTESFEVEYEVNMFTDEKVVFAYEGTQDSGYVVEKNTTPNPDAIAVGGTAEADDLQIHYLSCETYESDNMFVTPAEGCHFISCEFEVENTGSSDESVSSFLFDCYADGITCNQTYIRDDDLSATLSAGRRAKGTITFEVPDDAACVELEYVTNVWTSKRIIFTIR